MHRKPARYLTWALLLVLLAGCEPRQHLVQQHLLEFGTIIEITMIHADLRHAETLLAEVERRLYQQRQRYHAWEDSELSRFNRALEGEPRVRVPETLRPLLEKSQRYYTLTGGLFNPAMGRLIAAYGFHGAAADEARLEVLRRDLPVMTDLDMDGEYASSQNPELQLDFGAIAKGYAIGEVAQYLDENGIEHYLINAGGDLVTRGDRFGKPWRIGIRNPFAPGVFASIELRGRNALFTSGNYARRYQVGNRFRHHIIDPRSGQASTGQSSATVLSPDPTLADVAATALMIDGATRHRELGRSLGIDDYLVVTEDRRILVSHSFAARLKIRSRWPVSVID